MKAPHLPLSVKYLIHSKIKYNWKKNGVGKRKEKKKKSQESIKRKNKKHPKRKISFIRKFQIKSS